MANENHAANGSPEPRLTELLDLIEQRILPPVQDEPADDVAKRLGDAQIALSRVTAAKQAFFAGFASWLEHNGDLVIGQTRWYFGVNKTWKCLDKVMTVESILDHAGGDLHEFARFLSSKPFKEGSIKASLPPGVFEQIFVREVATVAKTGKPKGPTVIEGRVKP